MFNRDEHFQSLDDRENFYRGDIVSLNSRTRLPSSLYRFREVPISISALSRREESECCWPTIDDPAVLHEGFFAIIRSLLRIFSFYEIVPSNVNPFCATSLLGAS